MTAPARRYGVGQRVAFALAGTMGWLLIRLYYVTVRIRRDARVVETLRRNPCPPGIYPFWHSHQLSMVYHFRGSGAAILVSQSRDGEYIARIAERFGLKAVRGSSSRAGAAGLQGLLNVARAGRSVSITPDGPRGPRQCVHPGVLALARNTGLPVIPMTIGLSRFWELPSWDRFRIPKPFSQGWAMWGEAMIVPPDADDDALRALAEKLRAGMIALEAEADRIAREGISGDRRAGQGRP